MKKSELDKTIIEYNTIIINHIIEEIQKVIFINKDLDPIELYKLIYNELNKIYEEFENDYKFILCEDIYLHVDDYINPYAEAAYREINKLAYNITQAKTISELVDEYSKLESVLSDAPYRDYSDKITNPNTKKRKQ